MHIMAYLSTAWAVVRHHVSGVVRKLASGGVRTRVQRILKGGKGGALI